MPKRSDFSPPPNQKPSKKTARNGSTSRIEWKGYINVPLLEADKRHYHQWKLEPGLVDDIRETILRDGFKLSLDFQSREDAYRASLYCQNPDYLEAGYCLSVFASTPFEAERRLLYIHAVKCQGSWERWVGQGRNIDDWDEYE